ncbi:MAG: hypothetical protein EZS28_053810 [Streblomastix strix]|uniref:Uncharacterized protein n=1 Tax=Streblomastix strix TaxID=222440 RepID=A0A5J4R0P9_9EUKA|nr:MAG: hypothetical protein EZS28_053810 [Streblomastix strix]
MPWRAELTLSLIVTMRKRASTEQEACQRGRGNTGTGKQRAVSVRIAGIKNQKCQMSEKKNKKNKKKGAPGRPF